MRTEAGWPRPISPIRQSSPRRSRASKDTANRRLAVLKACLNLAFRNGIVASDTAWRRVKRFENTSAARKLFLTEKQVAALLAKAAGGVHNA